MAGEPHAAVWLDIPGSCQLRATFTGDMDVHVMIGQPTDELNILIARPALARLVEIAIELLAVPVPDNPETELPGLTDAPGQHRPPR
ncbi:hypothetical protein [Actinophytocola xanthii]|uniref:Uncharacterized protein n=1 Tax=Actinophytocola xanthii TaxID=1912961 RepID=A0A1Q8CU93_9PSEU|nr:hypothetical protein [Actinophytocola xanthii]OLF17931.1 hypothetical protein BU204_08970 [Actinophytocola xanthii]